MAEFNDTRWANAEFAREYRDNADIYIVERQRLFEIMKSFYGYFIQDNKRKRVLDLGCGDGIVLSELLSVDNSISAFLVDPSENMLARARERLNGFNDISFIRASFQEIIKKDILAHTFDFAVSAQAIHHLTSDEKRELFRVVYSLLNPDGYFLNIDVVIAQTESLENWYMKLWQEWMDVKISSAGRDDVSFHDIIRRYRETDENKPDTLDSQLNVLKDIGFTDVECHYKYGIFAVYSGKK